MLKVFLLVEIILSVQSPRLKKQGAKRRDYTAGTGDQTFRWVLGSYSVTTTVRENLSHIDVKIFSRVHDIFDTETY